MILEGIREKELFTDNIPFRIAVNTEENFAYPSHWHNAIELIYPIDDICKVTVNKKEYMLEANDILIVAAGDIHNFEIHNNKGTRYFIQLDYSKLLASNTGKSVTIYQYKTLIITSKENKIIHDLLEEQIRKGIHEYNNIKASSNLYLYARFLDTVVILSHIFENDTIQNNNKIGELTKLEKAFEYIHANYQKQIPLSEVANFVGFSEYYFSRVFKKATEKSFNNYLNEYRIDQAEKLLFDNCNITEAAYASGFNSLGNFNRIFKKMKGCSPSEFIKKRV